MKKKKIIIAIAIVVILLATAGIVVWRVFFPDLFKKKQDLFWDKAEAAVGLSSSKITDYSKFLDEYKSLAGKACKSELNVSANLDLSSSNIDSDVQNIINSSTLKIESSVGADHKSAQEKIGLYKDNSEVLTLDMVTDGDKYGIKCADLSDKYYAVSLDELLDYVEKNSTNSSLYSGNISSSYPSSYSNSVSSQIANTTDRIRNTALGVNDIDPYELLYISEDDLKHLDNTYGDIFRKLISKDCYSTERNVEIKIDGKKVKTTGYYLTLTGEDGYNFIKDLADVVKNDDVLPKILTDKANLILDNMGEDKVDTTELSDAIKDLMEELVSSAEALKEYDDVAIQIAVYNNKSASRIDINYIENADKPDKRETLATIENNFTKNTDKEKAGKLTLSASKMTVATIDYEIVDKDDESKLAFTIDVPTANMNLSVNLASKGNYKKEPVTIDGSLKISYEGESAEIKFDGKLEYDADVSIPTLTSKNSVDVLSLSEKEQKEELNKLLEKASEVLPARLKLLGINVKAEDIYKKVESPSEDTLKDVDTDALRQQAEDTLKNVDTDALRQQTEDALKNVDTDALKQQAEDALKNVDTDALKQQAEDALKNVDTDALRQNANNAIDIMEQNKSLLDSLQR